MVLVKLVAKLHFVTEENVIKEMQKRVNAMEVDVGKKVVAACLVMGATAVEAMSHQMAAFPLLVQEQPPLQQSRQNQPI